MGKKALISVALGTYNRYKFLKLTINSIRKELSGFPHEIIVVDGGSTDRTLAWLTKQKDIITIVQHNRGKWKGKRIERRSWGYFMNLGFRVAEGKYICMLSDDCLLVPGAIHNGYKLFEDELKKENKIGAVAFYWRSWPWDEDNSFWVGLTLGGKMFVNHGIFLKQALEEVGYIDEDSYHFYHADGDLCLKIWSKGYSIIDSPESFIEHYSHANFSIRKSNTERQKADLKTYLQKWDGTYYKGDGDDIGGNIRKSFDDPFRTSRQFLWMHIFNIRSLFGLLRRTGEKYLKH
jgi:glycosyltransferase involved in cell wall biosynthesis